METSKSLRSRGFPDGFLELMGVSSAGYLGGKLARKPGPVVKVLSVANVTMESGKLPDLYKSPTGRIPYFPVLTINVKGDNLDPKCSIKVDGEPLRGDLFWINNPTPPDPQSGFCNELNVSLDQATGYLEGLHTLTIVNSDAQAADVSFPIDPMSIDSVSVPSGAPVPNDVTITGKNFAKDTEFEWRDANGGMVPLIKKDDKGQDVEDRKADVKSETELRVSRPPGVTTGFTLTLISPVKLRASKKS